MTKISPMSDERKLTLALILPIFTIMEHYKEVQDENGVIIKADERSEIHKKMEFKIDKHVKRAFITYRQTAHDVLEKSTEVWLKFLDKHKDKSTDIDSVAFVINMCFYAHTNGDYFKKYIGIGKASFDKWAEAHTCHQKHQTAENVRVAKEFVSLYVYEMYKYLGIQKPKKKRLKHTWRQNEKNSFGSSNSNFKRMR